MWESLVQHVTLRLSTLTGTGDPARKTPGSPPRAEETSQPAMTLVLINGVTELTRALQGRWVVYLRAGSRRQRILRESDMSMGVWTRAKANRWKGRKGQTQEEQQESRNTTMFKTGPTAVLTAKVNFAQRRPKEWKAWRTQNAEENASGQASLTLETPLGNLVEKAGFPNSKKQSNHKGWIRVVADRFSKNAVLKDNFNDK